MRFEMEVTITNIYANETPDDKNLKGDHGQAFFISIGDDNVLFDTGTKSDILLHNMRELGISPTDVSKIIFSHGHYDHTKGFPGFLDSIDPVNPLPVFGHPSMTEKKILKLGLIKRDIGYPKLSEEQQKKIDLHLTKKPVELAKGLSSTGEINIRSYRDGREPNALHMIDEKITVDPMLDDLSLVLETTEGLVLITGCCHAGLLNTMEQVRTMKHQPIKAIIGGTHMVRFSQKEVENVADILEKDFGLPDLYLNHCTDNLPIPLVRKTPVTKILKKRFGETKVKTCSVGMKLTYEI
jgi:7,8-dihydropterin-6-yl-methyl-4-(beta-D-ribofuranosyl)aminobenzene 5'-phosphate synthase